MFILNLYKNKYTIASINYKELKMEVKESLRSEVNIYCDESCHLERDIHKSMIIGGISCPIGKIRDITQKIKQLKEKHGLPRNREIKWIKISPAKQDFYKELIDLFTKESSLRFRAIKVVDKNQLNHAKFNQTHNDWYYKIYYDMLKHILQPHKNYNIYIDIKDTIGCEKICKLKEILEYKKHGENLDILKIQQIRSNESELLQLADVLIGAVGYYDRIKQDNYSKAKKEICKLIEENLSIDFNRKSRFTDEKFNLFLWEGQDSK